MTACGSVNTDRACINIVSIKKGKDNKNKHNVISNSIHHGPAFGITLKKSFDINIENNDIIGFVENAVFIKDTYQFTFSKNIIANSGKRIMKSASPPTNIAFNFEKLPEVPSGKEMGIRITDNSIYGFVEAGFWLSPGGCRYYVNDGSEDADNKVIKQSDLFKG